MDRGQNREPRQRTQQSQIQKDKVLKYPIALGRTEAIDTLKINSFMEV